MLNCFLIFFSHLRLALPLYFFLQTWKALCPETIRSIVLYSRPLSLCFCLSALLSSEPYLPITQVQKTSYLTRNKEHFYSNISAVLSRMNVVKFDHVMLCFFQGWSSNKVYIHSSTTRTSHMNTTGAVAGRLGNVSRHLTFMWPYLVLNCL